MRVPAWVRMALAGPFGGLPRVWSLHAGPLSVGPLCMGPLGVSPISMGSPADEPHLHAALGVWPLRVEPLREGPSA